MTKLKIITNPLKMWMLRLEAKLSRNSCSYQTTSDGARMVRIKIHDSNYLYMSPKGKEHMRRMANGDKAMGVDRSFTNWLKNWMDVADVKVGRWISSFKRKDKKNFIDRVDIDSVVRSMMEEHLLSKFDPKTAAKEKKKMEKRRAERKTVINDIRNGKMASMLEAFNFVELDQKKIESNPILARFHGEWKRPDMDISPDFSSHFPPSTE